MIGKEPPPTLSELAGELATPIARYMTSRDTDFPGAQKGSRLFHHSAIGTFEAAHNALGVLGLLKNIPEDDPKRRYEFRGRSQIASVELAMAASEFPAHLKSVAAVSQEDFIEVLETFVDVLESYAAQDYYHHSLRFPWHKVNVHYSPHPMAGSRLERANFAGTLEGLLSRSVNIAEGSSSRSGEHVILNLDRRDVGGVIGV